MMLRGLKALSFLLVVAACGCGGGGQSTYITRFPDWNWRAYERLAVVPVHCPEGDQRAAAAAQQATSVLEDLLAANGNFTVLERGALQDVMTEQDLSQLADVADPATVLPPGKVQIAQALIVGKITEYDEKAERVERRVPDIRIDRRGRVRKVGQKIVHYYRHAGVVGGSVRVIDAATGKVMYAGRVPAIVYDDEHKGSPPAVSPGELAVQAAKEMAVDFYKQVAPVRTEVRLSGDTLLVALDYYDGEYDKTKEISTDLEEFLLVVRQLPRECDRNSFRVAIAPEEGRNIFEREFVWTSNNPVRGEAFKVPVDLLKSSGGEKFVAKLYSGDDERPLLEREFELKLPKKDD